MVKSWFVPNKSPVLGLGRCQERLLRLLTFLLHLEKAHPQPQSARLHRCKQDIWRCIVVGATGERRNKPPSFRTFLLQDCIPNMIKHQEPMTNVGMENKEQDIKGWLILIHRQHMQEMIRDVLRERCVFAECSKGFWNKCFDLKEARRHRFFCDANLRVAQWLGIHTRWQWTEAPQSSWWWVAAPAREIKSGKEILWEEAMNMCVWSQAKASSNQYESYYPAWTSLSTTSLTGLNVACLTIIDTLHYFCSCVRTSWIGFYPFLGFALIVVESEECTERRQGVERPMQFVDSLLVNAFRELDQTYNICWISQHLLQGEISAHLVSIGGGMYWAFHWEYIYIYIIHIYTHSFIS